MYVLLIIDRIGNVREWTRGTRLFCERLARELPIYGWRLFKIKRLSD